MHYKSVASIGILLLSLTCIQSVSVAFADVPAVVGITREQEGNATLLVIQIRHNSPSSNHYIDAIEIDVDGKVDEKTDVERPQSSATFSVKYAVAAAAKTIQVRAHCNIHGWSSWVGEGNPTTSAGGGIPGFPYESIALGAILGVLLLMLLRRR